MGEAQFYPPWPDEPEGDGDDYYNVDPDQEDHEVEARLARYEEWLDRT